MRRWGRPEPDELQQPPSPADDELTPLVAELVELTARFRAVAAKKRQGDSDGGERDNE